MDNCADARRALQYNTLNELLPQYDELHKRLLRSAVIGFSASAVSDTCSNSIRVVKTSKQASVTKTTYPQIVQVRRAGIQKTAVPGRCTGGFMGA